MLWATTLFIAFSSFCAAKEDVDLGEFPWTVSLKLVGLWGHDCGGAILNEVSISNKTENPFSAGRVHQFKNPTRNPTRNPT